MARDRKVEEAGSNHKIILHVRISECLFTCLSSYLSDSQFCLPIPRPHVHCSSQECLSWCTGIHPLYSLLEGGMVLLIFASPVSRAHFK